MIKTLNLSLVAILVVVATLFLSARKDYPQTENILNDRIEAQHIPAESFNTFPLPKSLVFADEQVPLERMDIREMLDRELIVTKFYHSSTILFLKRANRWFPVIEPILAEQGVPDDFKYIAQSESGLENVVSPMQAVGFWQFREAAAKEQGLLVNKEIDERYHVEKSTIAACQYLKELKKQFGTWTMAMAAYNYGPANIKSQIERQGQNSYWDILLPTETSRYVFRVMAYKMVYENRESFGFILRDDELYPPLSFKQVKVNTEINSWKEFCDEKGITYKTLKYYNPWLRESYLKNLAGKEFDVKLPQE